MTEALLADGFEAALIGIGTQFQNEVAVYDYYQCISILKERDGMNFHEAFEWMENNVCGSYVGESTPVFVFAKSVEEYLSIDEDGHEEAYTTGQFSLGGEGSAATNTPATDELD